MVLVSVRIYERIHPLIIFKMADVQGGMPLISARTMVLAFWWRIMVWQQYAFLAESTFCVSYSVIVLASTSVPLYHFCSGRKLLLWQVRHCFEGFLPLPACKRNNKMKYREVTKIIDRQSGTTSCQMWCWIVGSPILIKHTFSSTSYASKNLSFEDWKTILLWVAISALKL